MINLPSATTSQTPRIVPWLVAAAFFMQMLDSTILNIALPGMAKDFHVDALRMQSAVIAYLLTAALLIPTSGWLAGKFGTRKVFFVAIVIFTLGSLLCALSLSLEFLLMARVVQGIGGALMVPVGRLTILKAYPRSELVRILSFITIPGMVGPLFGPVAGGFLVEYVSWHWIFLINIPVGIVGAFLTLRYIPQIKDSDQPQFDTKGFFLFGLAMVCITMAMEGFGELHLPRVQATALSILGLILMCTYWLRCSKMDNALFSLKLFNIRSFSVGIFGNLFSRIGAGAMPFLTPLFLQLVLGYSPFAAGMFMMPTAVAAIGAKQIINRLVYRFGFRRLLTVNTVLLGIAIACFALVDNNTHWLAVVTLLLVFGAVNSMQFTAMNSLSLIDLPPNAAGSGNSLLSVTMQISAVAGVSMAAMLISGFTSFFESGASAGVPSTVFQATFVVVGFVSFASFVIFLQTPVDAGKTGTVSGTSKAVREPLQPVPSR